MKKNKILFIFTILFLSFTIFLIPNITNNQMTNVNAANEKLTLINKPLETKLKKILNKKENEFLYPNDFTKLENFVVLDLSNSNINNITELAYFEFPETLKAINLADNNINNSDFTEIYNILDKKKGDKIYFNKTSFTCNYDFTSIIEINIAFNQINLNEINNIKDNKYKKYIFGFQLLDTKTNNKFILKNDINFQYYKDKDNQTILSNIKIYNKNNTDFLLYNLKDNTIININIESNNNLILGKYVINMKTNGDYTNFNNWNKKISLTIFDAKLKHNSSDEYYTVERLSNFSITPEDILINGLDVYDGFTASNPDGGSTKNIGINNCTITINLKIDSKNTKILKVNIPYKVIDTTPPIIKLKGPSILDWKLNKEWVEPGYTITDNGENIIDTIIIEGYVNTSEIGVYLINYKYKDISNNESNILTRRVNVVAGIIDTVTIRDITKDRENTGEILIVAELNNDINLSIYKNIQYSWYVNDSLVETLKAESGTGNSSFKYIPDKDTVEIKVKVTANLVSDNSEVTISSNVIKITPQNTMTNMDIVMISICVVIIIIMIIIAMSLFIKSKTKKISSKSNKKSTKQDVKEEKSNYDIQIISKPNPNENNQKDIDNDNNKK